MKRTMVGVISGLAIWFGSALAAEAQQITPTGPMHIVATDTSVVYSATITTNYSFTLYLTVRRNGTTVYSGQWYCVNFGPSFNFQSPALNTSTWGMQVGNTINFHTVVQITPLMRSTNDYNVIVEPGGTTMAPPTKSDIVLAQALPPRKNELEELLAATDGSIA
jgi:hypothetical protein